MSREFVLTIIFINIMSFVFFALKMIFAKQNEAKIRLMKAVNHEKLERNQDGEASLYERTVRPFLDEVASRLLKITPNQIKQNLELKIIVAGKPFNYSMKDWMNFLVTTGLTLSIIVGFISISLGLRAMSFIFLIFCSWCLIITLPNIILNKKIKVRKFEVNKALPDVLDLLTVSVEAGLGFDSALSKVVEKMPGAISKEFEIVLSEMKLGRQKKDALKSMVKRLDVDDIKSFVTAVIQADQLGVSIGNVFRIQSEQIREKRRQKAKEKAMKAPIKMLIPMVLFIFPTIFIVLIGPVIIKVIHTFTN